MPTHPIKNLANNAPFVRGRVGPLRASHDSAEAIDDKDRAKVAADYWSKIWSERDVYITGSQIKNYLKDYVKKVNIDLIPDVTYDDILFSIQRSNNSSAGPDGVSFAAWRAVPEFSANVLFKVFNALTIGQLPHVTSTKVFYIYFLKKRLVL